MRWLLVWQVPLLPEQRVVSPGGRLIVAEYNRCSKFPGTPTTSRANESSTFALESKREKERGREKGTKRRRSLPETWQAQSSLSGELRLSVPARYSLANTPRRYRRDLIPILNHASTSWTIHRPRFLFAHGEGTRVISTWDDRQDTGTQGRCREQRVVCWSNW